MQYCTVLGMMEEKVVGRGCRGGDDGGEHEERVMMVMVSLVVMCNFICAVDKEKPSFWRAGRIKPLLRRKYYEWSHAPH